MKETARRLLLPVILMASVAGYAQDDLLRPARVAPDLMSGLDLMPGAPPVPEDMVVSGNLDVRRAIPFTGEELRVIVFESLPAKTDHTESAFEFDEFVYVLSGKLILTDLDGTAHEYTVGDSLVVPKGWRGYWEMQGNYRELVVIATPTDSAPSEQF
ncbi:MAG: cupin domain-containing protein [Proteobacteria bacterium]|nr:cupin domain-containing protein [Pseudomonadota bacterium]MYJ97080.1 cupin domain-containing protein [Pseudomonadota bacterium]